MRPTAKTRLAIIALSIVSPFMLAAGQTPTQEQEIIGGTRVSLLTQQKVGLVSVAATSATCSGVLLTERWVLTAGHCFAQGKIPAATVSFAGTAVASDQVYVFGSETDADGKPNTRGYDLALVRLSRQVTAAPFRQKEMALSLPRIGTSVTYYGQGLSTYFRPGPPPVPSLFGTMRRANMAITGAIITVRSPWPNTIVAATNSAGQVCAPGDSGGPVFLFDEGRAQLLAIQVSAHYECVNRQSVDKCKATITKISDCRANLIPVQTVKEIIASSWKRTTPTQVFDVSQEIYPYLFFDPAREGRLDLNVRGWAIAARAVNEMCFNRGFVSGHMTGHQLGQKFGVVCAGQGAVWRDVFSPELAASGWLFTDADTVQWSHAQRAATNLCVKNGFVGGHFNGHQRLGMGVIPAAFGLVCYGPPAVFFDATTEDINGTGWPVGDLNTVEWAQAARAATNFCGAKGFPAGFMTGHQVTGKYGVVCQRRPVGSNDFNDDERGDILWHNASTGESQIWFMSSSSRIGRASISDGGRPTHTGPPWRIVGSRDFNGDGKTDVLWHNSSTGELQIWFMNGSGFAGRAAVLGESGTAAFVGLPWSIVGANDFNGDRNTDVLWHNGSTGETQIWFMNGYRVIRRQNLLGENGRVAFVGLPWSIVGTHDFNVDGKSDVLWHNGSTGETQVWFMNGYTVSGRATVLGETGLVAFVRLPWRIAGTNDFDQDGAADILWHNGSTGEAQIWFMNGRSVIRRTTVDATSDGGGSRVALPWSIINH